MASRRGRLQGGVIRTYARLRPLRKIESQKWFSPKDCKHLFSSSSSCLDSSLETTSSEDPEYKPSTRRKATRSCRKVKLKPDIQTNCRKKKKKSLQPQRKSRENLSSPAQSTSDEKENEERLHPSSSVDFSTPFRKFVTIRRKGPGVTMKPLSSKPKRNVDPFLSPDSCDFKADNLTLKKRRKMCTDVTNLLSSSTEILHSPLEKPPLLSSTPSMVLTAVPRKGNTFVRQLALSEPLDDSVVISAVDSDVNERVPSSCRNLLGRMTRTQSEVTLSRKESSDMATTATEESERNTAEFKTPGVKSLDKGSFGAGHGSGVKRLIIQTSNNEKLSPVCLVSPESQTVLMSDAKMTSRLHGHSDNVFGTSAELFSSDDTLNKETAPVHQENRETTHRLHCSSNAMVHVLNNKSENLGDGPSTWCLSGFSPNKWKHFSRKQFQPFVRLNSQIVTKYFQQNSKDLLNKSSVRYDSRPNVTAPVMDSCVSSIQPVVSLDSAAVTKYLLTKDEVSDDSKNIDILPKTKKSPVLDLSCHIPTFQIINKTPQITTSVLKNKMQNSAVPQTVGTGRKVCISGFSAKRWGTLRKKTATKTKQHLSFQDRSREDLCVGDTHSSSLFSSSLLTESFMNSTAVMNLNLSTESLTGRDPQKEHQRWARLRAALSLHRRKKVEAGSPSSYALHRNGGKMSMNFQNSSLLLLSPFQSSLSTHELTDAEKVFAECQQDKPIPFYQCLTRDQLSRCQKVGEGVYGEVFRTLRGRQHVALKVIPIEGCQKVNGEHQKSFAEILPEIIISKELSLLSEGEANQTSGFIQLHIAHCVQGSYPQELLSAWDTFAEDKGTENERPDLFGPEQLFMILEFEFGGEDLECMSSRLPSVAASRSILHQVTAALAVAEEELRFEHRDLHWGNLLIEKSVSCTMSVSLNGEIFDIPNAGVQVKIIDYTLSRLDKDGLTVFCDLSTDEELFMGEGDLQFEVYKIMRQKNQNVWSSYKPYSNVLWLHYLCDKLLSEVKYIKKPTSAPQRRELRRLQDFRREVQQFGSATEVLKRSRLFK
ncbi:hypothetical protein GDO78_003064 [Eleutherodactylus coqui]|uniref:Serine/threonine-protein kinase haspin n=2 Tax=Eleutherodactylus coqui TaxID=57060 RepID=A0A8J6K2D6_ELECQ|nr:hypothetical protein GDO78_003064 [Eleutherodactylus coqui]